MICSVFLAEIENRLKRRHRQRMTDLRSGLDFPRGIRSQHVSLRKICLAQKT